MSFPFGEIVSIVASPLFTMVALGVIAWSFHEYNRYEVVPETTTVEPTDPMEVNRYKSVSESNLDMSPEWTDSRGHPLSEHARG